MLPGLDPAWGGRSFRRLLNNRFIYQGRKCGTVQPMRRTWIAAILGLALLTPFGAVAAQDGDDGDEDLPDLEADDLEPTPQEPMPNQTVRFHATIENAGDADAGPFNVTFQLDGEQLGDPVEVPGLGAGNTTEVVSDGWQATEGEHQINVTVDADEAITEEDEENNAASETFDVEAAQPDDPEAPDDERDEDEADDGDDAAARGECHVRDSSFEVDNGTYTGDHVRFAVDLELPGLTGYAIGDNATVFDEIALPAGEELECVAHRDIFAMENEAGELMLRDRPSYRLAIDGEDNASATMTVADGVDVSENETFDDDENESLYELSIGNRTLYLWGENLTFENGTFTVNDEAQMGASFPPEPQEREDRDEEAEERREERREEARERREEMREAGSQWDRTNDTFQGDHVSFTLDADLPGVRDYGLHGSHIAVFDEIALPQDNESEWEAHGVKFEFRTDDARLRLLDVPPAVMVIEADDGSPVTLDVADGVNVTKVASDDEEDDDEDDERSVYRLGLSENRTAWLAGEAMTFDNGTFTVEDRAHFRSIPAGFEGSPNSGPGSMPDQARDDRGPPEERGASDERGPPQRALELQRDVESQVERAIANGEVGVEVHVTQNDTDPVALELGHVEVRKAWANARGESKAGVTISAPDGSPGTVVTLNLNARDLGNLTVAQAAQELTVRFDNETIAIADDLEDALNWRNDDGEPEYLLLVGGDKVQVLVTVPHFSTHEIEVQSAQTQSADSANGTPGFTAVTLLAAVSLAGVLAAARTRRN